MTQKTLVAEAAARHEQKLHRYCLRLVRDADLARDVVQEAFGRLRVVEPPPDNPLAWLYRVARNYSLDLLRKRSACEPLKNPQWLAADANSFDPSVAAQRNEEYEMLMREMNALPAREREAVRLKFQEGLSYAEIAVIIGETKTTVGWLLHSAIKSLREKMK